MTPVTKAYLPNKDKYKSYIDRIYDTAWLTNNGTLLQELERRLKEHLGVKHLILVANGSFPTARLQSTRPKRRSDHHAV